MIKYILPIILLFSSMAEASRVLEVEDYYSERVSDFIKRRYPNRPFTALVKVDTGDDKENRNTSISTIQLPYLEMTEAENDIWSRKDIPLTTLITYVNSVSIQVEIDVNMDANELNDFHKQMFDFLKLSPTSDKIEIKKMDWSSNGDALERRIWLYGGIAIPLLLILGFFVVSRLSIRSLVKGLSQPIAEIGKSTQAFASNAMAFQQPKNSSTATESTPSSFADSNYELRKVFKEMMTEYESLFSQPTPEIIELLESEGKNKPQEVGTILLELNRDSLKNIFKFGYGEWWFHALSSSAQIKPSAVEVLHKFNSLKTRQQLTSAFKKPVDAKIIHLGLILNRLSLQEIDQLFKGIQLKKSFPILSLLPRDKCMSVCKSAYPGEWASAISETPGLVDTQLAVTIQDKALKLKPLRDESALNTFFTNLDLIKYLDNSSTKDESEFYKALPEDSVIKKERTPFFAVFSSSDEILKNMCDLVQLEDWAYALKDCTRDESSKIFTLLSDRQKYFLKNLMVREAPDSRDKMIAKKRITDVFKQQQLVQKAQATFTENKQSEAA